MKNCWGHEDKTVMLADTDVALEALASAIGQGKEIERKPQKRKVKTTLIADDGCLLKNPEAAQNPGSNKAVQGSGQL